MSKMPEPNSISGDLPDTPIVQAALAATGGGELVTAILSEAVAKELAGKAGGGECDETYG